MTWIDEVQQYLAIAESSDSKKEAYRSAVEVLAAHKDKTGDSVNSIAMKLGMSRSKVEKMLAWKGRGYDTDSPYDEGKEKRQQTRARVSHAKRSMKDPTEREAVLKSLSDADKVAIASEVMAKPKVATKVVEQAKPEAAQAIRKASEDAANREAKQAIKGAKDRAASIKGATPLSQFFWRIVGQMVEWRRGLIVIKEEMDSLTPEQRIEVLKSHYELRDAVVDNIVALEGGDEMTPEDVIEGKVSEPRRRLNA